jgi:hypothetical protein
MRNKSVILLISVVLLVSVLTAGCTFNVGTPSPSPSASPSASTSASVTVKRVTATALPSETDLSTFFTSYMRDAGYTIVKPFSKHIAQNGNDQYNGTISDGKYVYAAFIEITGTARATATRYDEVISNAQDLGFTTYDEGTTYWTGYDSQTQLITYISEDIASGYVIWLVASSIA